MKFRKFRKVFSCFLTACFLFMVFVSPVFANATTTPINNILNPGDSITITDNVFIPQLPAKADIIFAFDLTASMGVILNSAKANALNIINTLKGTGVDIQYGVMSFMDYPLPPYGAPPDYPYNLNQGLTNNSDSVQAAINGLTLGGGGDFPECYTRILYESYSDSNIAWRSGSKKILIVFGDNVPHDNNINDGTSYPYVTDTGIDPGRDGIIGTDDDLDLQTVMAEMVSNNIVLLACSQPTIVGNFLDYWAYWAKLTGGNSFMTSSATFTADVTQAIQYGLTASNIYGLTLKASAGYESWLTSVIPSSYSGSSGITVPFEITISVPAGTDAGIYHFTIDAVDSANVNYGTQDVTITVPQKVLIDIKPDSTLNPINITEIGKLPVAILGSDVLDVKTIDPASILLGKTSLADRGKGTNNFYDYIDVNLDGVLDMICMFEVQELVNNHDLSMDSTTLTLKANRSEGPPIFGTDFISTK